MVKSLFISGLLICIHLICSAQEKSMCRLEIEKIKLEYFKKSEGETSTQSTNIQLSEELSYEIPIIFGCDNFHINQLNKKNLELLRSEIVKFNFYLKDTSYYFSNQIKYNVSFHSAEFLSYRLLISSSSISISGYGHRNSSTGIFFFETKNIFLDNDSIYILEPNDIIEPKMLMKIIKDQDIALINEDTLLKGFLVNQKELTFSMWFKRMAESDKYGMNEIPIIEIIPYLKKEHPFTKYLHQVVTSKK